ncbi:hypothetical protein DM02DRAFT_664391 [Periconia macrospinosa]|uniref:BTB domain-containing protein n=1 Tax=Periconia macrospinosa TaxID=97972 RepID=A0A2V1CZ67_9PLEO|nr:hypothetical protein DM02DRAFT_664391 [Periconia macrospinosa]
MANKEKRQANLKPLLEESMTPYIGSPVALCVGPKRREYYVSKHLFLQNSGRIASSLSLPSPYVYLPDIDERTGHVLAHYLHTGAYQTLDSEETSSAKIAGLQQLAIDEMEQCGTAMTISDVLEAANANFSKADGHTNWFQKYLTERLNAAFEEDFTIFTRHNFFDHIDNVDLYTFVVKCAVELYSNKISRMLHPERRYSGEEEEKEEAQKRKEEEEEAERKKEEAAAAAATTTDDYWGVFTAAASKKKKGKKGKTTEPLPPAADPATTFDDSTNGAPKIDMNSGGVVGGKSSGLGGLTSGWGSGTTESVAPAVEEKPAEDDGWGFSFGSKAKKGKKKGSAAPPESALPPADDDWGSFAIAGAKKTKGVKEELKAEEPPPPPAEPEAPPEPEPEPVVEVNMAADWEDYGCGAVATKGKKGTKDEPAKF